jgi:hypothetical protein
MLKYCQHVGFKKYTPGAWEILENGGGQVARRLCVIDKKTTSLF